MRDLFVVSCTRDTKEETPLYRSLHKLQIRDSYCFEGNRRGLPACYNEFLNQLAGSDRILVLAHSDITIADVFLQEKLNEAVKVFNIVGLVGSSYFDLNQQPHYAWRVWPAEALSGAVEHVLRNGMTIWSFYGPTPRRCVVMDGVLLAIDMRTIGNVRFDERFTFHLYDLDFCLTAHFANLVLGTTNVYVQHASIGDFGADVYQQAMQAFRAKWNTLVANQDQAEPSSEKAT
jgi:hypothetical protein